MLGRYEVFGDAKAVSFARRALGNCPDENCHASVTCQALGIPLFMDRTGLPVHMLKSGMVITVDADAGFVLNGIVS